MLKKLTSKLKQNRLYNEAVYVYCNEKVRGNEESSDKKRQEYSLPTEYGRLFMLYLFCYYIVLNYIVLLC